MTGEGGSQLEGRRLGSYELIRPIAQGGMADVYLGKRDDGPSPRDDGESPRRVAIKILNRQRALEPEACAMFLDEARLVGMLDHPNIARVLGADVADDGQHFLAMEYVHGADLRELLSTAAKAGRSIPFEVSLSIVVAAAAGLDHAHRRCAPDGRPLRLVHRDVSLSNIMVGHDGAVKVVDFGIASTAVQTVHTSPGVVRGKASYMAPEQCLGNAIDHRTDIFALGVVLYELTTGTRCFAGKSDFERMLAVVRGQYHAPTSILPSYPLELEQVVRTALASDPAQRFGSCHAMIEALEAVARGRGWALGPTPIARMMKAMYGTPTQTDISVEIERVDDRDRIDDARIGRVDDVRLGRVDDVRIDDARIDDARVDAARIDAARIDAARIDDARIDDARIDARIDDTQAMPVVSMEATTNSAPTRHSQRRLARGTNADGYVTTLADGDDDQPTRGRRPLPRRPSAPRLAA